MHPGLEPIALGVGSVAATMVKEALSRLDKEFRRGNLSMQEAYGGTGLIGLRRSRAQLQAPTPTPMPTARPTVPTTQSPALAQVARPPALQQQPAVPKSTLRAPASIRPTQIDPFKGLIAPGQSLPSTPSLRPPAATGVMRPPKVPGAPKPPSMGKALGRAARGAAKVVTKL